MGHGVSKRVGVCVLGVEAGWGKEMQLTSGENRVRLVL